MCVSLPRVGTHHPPQARAPRLVMAGNTEEQYGIANNDTKAEGTWGATPIMHSWCLQSNPPMNSSEALDGQRGKESHDSMSRRSSALAAIDADDDSGLELCLGLSLGGRSSSSSSKPKGKEREKETLLDRDIFQERDNFRASERRVAGGSKEGSADQAQPFLDGVVIQSLNSEQKGSSRVQPFWQEQSRSAHDGTSEKEMPQQQQPSQRTPSPLKAASPDTNWRPAESSVAEDSKMFARHMWQALQGKAAQPEHQRLPLSAQDEASLIKELQGLPPQAVATAAAWARFVAQGGVPLQLLEAYKEGTDPRNVLQPSLSLNSIPSSQHCEAPPAPAPPPPNVSNDLERSDSDVSKNMQMSDHQQRHVAAAQQQEAAEQQRKRDLRTQKRQEARKKRKASFVEGQKQSKAAKKEDERPASSGLGGKDSPPNHLRRSNSLQPPPGASLHSKESSISMASSPPDSQDASSIAAFRRPGSSSWLPNWEAPPQAGSGIPSSKGRTERMHPAPASDQKVDGGDNLLEVRRALDRAKDKGSKDRVSDGESGAPGDSGVESRKIGGQDGTSMKIENEVVSGGRHPSMRQENPGSLSMNMINLDYARSTQVDPQWIQKIIELQMNNFNSATMMEGNRDNSGKGFSSLPQMHNRGDVGPDRLPARATEKGAEKARASSQTSSGGSENSDTKDEKSNIGSKAEGETLTSSPVSSGGVEGGPRPKSSNALNSQFPPSMNGAVAIGNMAYPSGASFPMMPAPYPFPIPVGPAGAAGVPFPFPFPYVMQFPPPPLSADGTQDQRPHLNVPSPFQIALRPGYTPFQIQTPEGPSAWPPAVVRPHATPPQSPPRNGTLKRAHSGVPREDDNHSFRGDKGIDHAKSRNTSPAREFPIANVQGLARASSMGSGAFNRLRPTATAAAAANSQLSAPPGSHFGISRSKSDAAALRREGSTGSAFANLGEPSQGGGNNSQASSCLTNSPKGPNSVGSGPLPRRDSITSRGPADYATPPGSGRTGTPGASGQPDFASAQSTSSTDGEDVKRLHPTGVWRQGSLPLDGLAAQEASSLRPGIASGQHFGGTGSPPDLPWVTCTGTNGKNISGVLYRVEKGQVRIVCACHGRHMSPGEFVQHAGCGDMPNPEKAIVVAPFTIVTQQPASAQA